MFAMAARNPYTHDNHFRPQVTVPARRRVTVFRLEDGLGRSCAGSAGSRGIPAPEALPHDLKAGKGAAGGAVGRGQGPDPSAFPGGL
jgi:hypothetical protein